MRRLLALLIGSVAVAAVTGFAPALALAQGGTGTSAGDQQYVDPLTSTTPAPSTAASSPSTPSASSSASPSTSGSSPSASTGSASSPPASASPSSSATLPYTGLNLWPLVLVGIALIAGGALIRLALRRT